MRNKCTLLLLITLFLVSCTPEEEYIPIKKTGYEAPPIKISLYENEEDPLELDSQDDSGDEEEINETIPEGEISFHDFKEDVIFEVTDYEIACFDSPGYDSYVLVYVSEGNFLKIVDKIIDEDGNSWYTVNLFEFGFTYGFTPTSGLEIYSH